jgi:hypothetical protein
MVLIIRFWVQTSIWVGSYSSQWGDHTRPYMDYVVEFLPPALSWTLTAGRLRLVPLFIPAKINSSAPPYPLWDGQRQCQNQLSPHMNGWWIVGIHTFIPTPDPAQILVIKKTKFFVKCSDRKWRHGAMRGVLCSWGWKTDQSQRRENNQSTSFSIFVYKLSWLHFARGWSDRTPHICICNFYPKQSISIFF